MPALRPRRPEPRPSCRGIIDGRAAKEPWTASRSLGLGLQPCSRPCPRSRTGMCRSPGTDQSRLQVPLPFDRPIVDLAIQASENGDELALMQDERSLGVVTIDEDGDRLKGYG